MYYNICRILEQYSQGPYEPYLIFLVFYYSCPKDLKPKYCLQLSLKCYSRFSYLVSKGGTGWWLEDRLASCEP